MPLEAPGWWRAASGPWPVLLQPLAAVYGLAVTGRWRLVRPVRASVPVICVGNLTVGGAGKTPVAIAVAEALRGLGETPAFLSRGYGGRVRGPHRVRPEEDTATAVGDEPLLLAGHAPTIVSRDRTAGAEAAIAEAATVVVMDDGFQNPSLHKDLAIVVVDGETGTGNGRVLPAGPLRAPLAFQLERLDALVVLGAGDAARPVVDAVERAGRPTFTAHLAPHGDTGWVGEKPLVAFAGIARPQKFFATLTEMGADIRERVAFPDHHVFDDEDARRLLAAAERHGAALATTEKDWARMAAAEGGLRRLKEAARALPVAVSFDDQARFAALLASRLSAPSASVRAAGR